VGKGVMSFYLRLNDALILSNGHPAGCNSLDVAKGFAERVAAVLGHHRSDEEIDGLFIRVTDAAEAELFRTPVRNDPSLGTLH
jgi:hypothetical protein